jgi:single-strand DNA-binding protein
MNHLNSIIVEGELTSDPSALTEEKQGTHSCLFPIQSQRYFKSNGKSQIQLSSFTVVTYSRVAESCLIHLRGGRGIRVVGRLVERQSDDPEDLPPVYIIAEHVEFKPQIKAS